MRILLELFSRLMAHATATSAASARVERRRTPRHTGGASLGVNTSQPVTLVSLNASPNARGRQLDGSTVAVGVLRDVSRNGFRFDSRQSFPVDRRLVCRVQSTEGMADQGLRIVWCRPSATGFEYGAAFTPVVAGACDLLDPRRSWRGVRSRVAS